MNSIALVDFDAIDPNGGRQLVIEFCEMWS